ncbi:MAG: HAMP domain-containing protein [Thermoplasmatales archaeon]|nr:HAMP domain-containing protein [Thermoplasmatales archaeon]MCK4995426.1 HAMP domain-containing protein [Thermoplasmatales archaeon]
MRARNSLSLKLTLIVVVIPAIVILSLTYINFVEQTVFFEEAYEEKATALAQALDASISKSEELVEENKDNLFKDIIAFMTISKDSGIEKVSINLPDPITNILEVFVSSDVNSIETLSDSHNEISFTEDTVVRVPMHTEGSHTLTVITPLHVSGGIVGTYEIVLSMDDAYAALNARVNNFFMISAVSLLILVISFLFLLRRTIIQPITTFRNAANMIGEGNLDTEINIKTRDELGDLATAFNNMTNDLKTSRAEIKNYSKTLEIKVDERTKELEGSKEELRGKVEALEKNKLALLNIMSDLKITINDLEQTKKEINFKNIDLNKAQKELSDLNRDLEQIVKERTAELEKVLKHKDEFINQLGHDLKNPIVPITNLLPVLIKKVEDPELLKYLEIISRRIHYIKNLVVQILEFARLSSPLLELDVENLNLLDITNQVFEDNELIFKQKNIKINNMINEKIFVDADKLKIEELINNLSINAVKYMDEGGIITINADEDKDFINISIKDTGVGLTDEELSHVFDEFYKADWSRHDQNSIGLGLSICKRIIEKHGGKIWAESSGHGKGSTFYFSIQKDLNKNKEKN